MRRGSAIILLALLATACQRTTPSAQPPEPAATANATSDFGVLNLSLSQTEMSTVERLSVRLVLEHAGGVSASDLHFEPSVGGWTIASRESSQASILPDGNVRLEWKYTLEPFLEGAYQVPPASIELSDGQETATLSTPPQPVTVTSVLAGNDRELAPVRPPVDVSAGPGESPGAIIIAGAIAGVLAAAGALWWWRHARPPTATSAEPFEPCAGARGEVEHLRRQLRASLTLRIGAISPTATSDEMVAAARATLGAEQGDRLSRTLERIDRLLYGPDEPRDEDVATLASELATLGVREQEAPA